MMRKGSFSPAERYGAVKSGIACCVILLDGTECIVEVNKKAPGQAVFDHVLRKLEILERDYFGLQYEDEQKTLQWLDLLKPVKKQLKKSYQMFFRVKYFALDPMTLHGSSRNQFYMQLRQEITEGRIFCPPHNLPSILSYILQADIGDYESAEKDTEYMSEKRHLPVQSKELESEIAKFHQFHRGMNPREAVNRFFRLIRDLDSYGMHFTNVKYDDMFYQLGLCPSGVAIHKGTRRISFYSWARVMEVCYKNKRFTIRVLGQGPDEGEVNPLNFDLETVKVCKDLWRDTIDTLAFYSDPQKRLQEDPEGSSTTRSSRQSSRSSLTSPLSTGYDSHNPPSSQASYSPQLRNQPAHKLRDHTYSESGESDVRQLPELMSVKPQKVQTLPRHLPSNDPIAQALQQRRTGDGRPDSRTHFSDPSLPTSPEDLTSTSNSEEPQIDDLLSPLSDEMEQQEGASPLAQWARAENGVHPAYLEKREPGSGQQAEELGTQNGHLVYPDPRDSTHEYPSSSALVPRDDLSQDDMHDSLLDLADALGGSSDSEEGPEEVVNGASANTRVERTKPRPDLVPGQDGVSNARPTVDQDHSPRLHPSYQPPPDNPPPKPPRTNRPAYKTVMKESPILPDRNPLHQQQAKKQSRKLIHHWVQEHQLRSLQSSSQQSLDSNGSSNQERPSPNLRSNGKKMPDTSPSPLAIHRTVAGAKPFETSSLSTRSDGSSNSLPQLHPSGQPPSPVISRPQEGHEAAGLASRATGDLRSHDHHKTDREVPLPDSPAPPPYMSPSPDSEQARLLEQLGRGKQSKPPKPAPKPVSAKLSGRVRSLDAPDLTSVDNIIMPQVQNPKQVIPDGNQVSVSVTSTSNSSHSPGKNRKIHNIPFRTRTPDLIREIEEVMGNQQDPASAGGSVGSAGSLNRQSGSQSPKKPSSENARRPVTDSINPGGVKPSMEARHQRRGMERQLRKSQKRFNQLMKSKESSPGDSDHSGTGSALSGSGSGDLRGSGELLESGNFSPSDLEKDPFEIDPRNYLSAPSPVYDKLDDVEMPGDVVSSGRHQLEQSFVPPAPHITVGGFEMEDDQQTGDGLRNILQEVMSSDNLPPPPPHLMALSQELQERESQRPGYYADPLGMPPREPELQPHQQQPPTATTSGRSRSFDPRDVGRGRSHTTAGTYDPSQLPPEIASFMSRVRSVSTSDDIQENSKPAGSPTKSNSPRKGRRGSIDSTPQASPQVRNFSRGSAEVERSQSMSTYDSPKSIRSRQGNRETEFMTRASPTKRHHDPGRSLDSSQLQHHYRRREEHIPAQTYRGQKAAETSHFRHESSREQLPSAHSVQPHGGPRTGRVETANMHTRTGSIPSTWEYAQQDIRRAQSFNTARQVPGPLHPPPPACFFEEESIPNSPTYFAQNPPLDRDEVNPSPHTETVNRSFQDHLNSLNSGRRGRKTRVLDWMQRTSDAWGHDSRYPMMRDPASHQPAEPYLRPSHVYEEPDVALRRSPEEWQQQHQQQHRQQHRQHGHQGRPRGRNKGTAYASHTYAGHEQRQGYPTAKVGKDYYVIDV